MARYLSDEWLAAAHDALGPPPDADAADRLVIEQHVDGAPEGPVVWHVIVAGDARSIQAGPHPAPDVTFSQDYDTAVAVARGDLSAQEAFMTGLITLSGTAGALILAAPALAAVGDALAPLRAATTY